LIAKLQAKAACPVVATSAAMVDALQHVEIRRLALATPYIDSVTEVEQRFLEESGFQVVACRGLGLSGDAIREVPPERVRDLALEVDHPDAQALFISCTDLRALEIVAGLEEALNKPVLTSNQVTLWALLRACGYVSKLPGLGRLLAQDLVDES
jgi:maleate cis-trans isomerase